MWSRNLSRRYLNSRQIPSEVPDTPPVVVPIITPLPSSDAGPSSSRPSVESQTPIVAITAASLALIVAFILAFYILRHCRQIRKSTGNPSKNFFRTIWSRKSSDSNKGRSPSINEHIESTTRENGPDAADSASLEMAEDFDRPDRAASFRSVITLPSYIPTARQDEQVLGREGERGGIDVVVEFPTTVDEEEQQREEEMEALYQVRLARRRENESREERRRMRRAARERGESSTPREIEEGIRHTNSDIAGQSIEELRAEHDRLKRNRQRAVSVVSYAEIGVARHDGSRLNPGTPETEQMGLLGDAASISASIHPHNRGRNGSVPSICSMNSEIRHPLTPQMFSMENSHPHFHSHSIPLQTQHHDMQHSPLTTDFEHNFPSPLFMSPSWDTPRNGSNRPNPHARRSTSLSVESLNIVEEDPGSSNSPLNYRTVSLESPMEAEELPPDYTSPVTEAPGRNPIANGTNSSASGPVEGDSDGTVHWPKPLSMGSRFNTMRSHHLPSIHIDPASPVKDSVLETRLE